MSETPLGSTSVELLAETSKIAWRELQYFFAGGKAIVVDPRLDLIDVARQIAADNKETVELWMSRGLVSQVPDTLAKSWYENDAVVWAVVVKPWVLVQQVTT